MRRRLLSLSIQAFLLLACALLSGCLKAGPTAVKVGRPRYNIALADTDNRELLLNFVRLKYNEIPFFLEITSISSSPSVSADAALTGIKSNTQLRLGLNYSERPNIIYKPLGGERFTRQLMRPVDLQTIVLLHQAGWNLDRIFRVCVASVNEVRNAEPTNRPAPPRPPEYETFLRVAEAMAELEDDGFLDLGLSVQAGEGKPQEVLMHFEPEGRDSPLARQLFEDLHLDPGAPTYRMTTAATGGGGDTIAVVTRPLTAAMFFLSQGIEIPEEHLEKRIVAVTREDDNSLFDWSKVLGNLMHIRSSASPPENSFVAVPFRGNWYYIDDRDIESRTTFSFVSLLFTLQAGELPASNVVLTLPVTGQ